MRFLPSLLVLLATSAGAEIALRDDAGNMVRLRAPAARVVALAPDLVENVFAAGAGDHLVGVVAFSNFPPAAKTLPRLGGYAQVDLEALAAAKPDLVLAWLSGNAPAQLDRLRALGLPVFAIQPRRIDDIAANLERLGELAGTQTAAKAAAAAFRKRLAELRKRHGGRPKVRVFYEVWHQPLMTVGGGQIISDAISICGGENVFAALDALAPTVSEEAVLAADPEAIVASGMDAARPEWLDRWRRWPRLAAVRRGNLFFVPPDLLQRQTPRLLDGAEQLCGQLEEARARRPR